MNKFPLVLQLQADALDRSLSIADLILRAKVVATKLNAAGAMVWISRELNGYDGEVAAIDLPAYRQLRGDPKFLNPYHGWCAISSSDPEAMSIFSSAYLFEPIGTLEHLVQSSEKNFLKVGHNHTLNAHFVRQIGFACETAILISKQTVWSSVEKVRSLVLDWTLELESAGVRGEGMSFTMNEKDTAFSVTNNYFAHNIGVVGDVGGRSTVTNNQTSTQTIDFDAVGRLVEQLKQVSVVLPQESQQILAPLIADLDVEVRKSHPEKGKVAGLLTSVRTVCEGMSGNVIAAGVVEGIKLILGG